MVTVIASLNDITELKLDGNVINFKTDGMTLCLFNEDVTLNVDGTKKKIKMFDLVKAFTDAVNSGEFWMDEIDGIVSNIEADRQELREALATRRGTEVYNV